MLFSKCVHYFCVQNTLQKNNLHVGSLIFTSQFESMLSILEKKKKNMVAGSSTVAGVCSWHSSRLLYRWNMKQSGQEVVPCCNSSRPTPSDSLPPGSLHLPKAPENLNCVSSWDPRVQTQKPPGCIKCACKPQCKSKGFIRHFIP